MDSAAKEETIKANKYGARKNKKQKNTPIAQLTREELEARFMQVEAHNRQLQNLLAKCQGLVSHTLKSRKERPFDFSKHSRRHVLLKFAYLGWDYNGFAVQEDSPQTIEVQLFTALLKTRLIESREVSNYHRCGRTDKGVSAFDQVISITLRSNVRSGVGVILPDGDGNPTVSKGDDDHEIDYITLLNKVLPPEIRMLAWSPAEVGYSARFDCSYRTYKYFFPRGSLDIKLMNEAAQLLKGGHDYRNFCKMDVGNGVVNFCRRIVAIDVCDFSNDTRKTIAKSSELKMECEIYPEHENCAIENSSTEQKKDSSERTTASCVPSVSSNDGVKSEQSEEGYDMCVATIEGQAFLWHQIRAVMAVLFLIGERKEEPSIIQELLNVEEHPKKPQYCLASDLPLNLYETTFDGVVWQWDNEVLRSVISQFQALWTQHSVRTTMIKRMLWDLETRYRNQVNEGNLIAKDISNLSESSTGLEKQSSTSTTKLLDPLIPQDQCESLVPGARTKVYRPLLSRPTCESLETRVKHYVKRQRLDPDILEQLPSSDVSAESSKSLSYKCKTET